VPNTEVFKRERLNAINVKGKRYYETPRGTMEPSVTTFLGVLPKAALDNWKLKTVAEFAVNNVNDWAKADENGNLVTRMPLDATIDTIKKGPGYDSRARDAGELVHKIAEDVLLGKTPYVPAGYEMVAGYINEFVKEFDVKLIAAEPQLINYEVGYAGSADLLASLTLHTGERVNAVLDYKSGSGIYGSVAYQCSAYAHAETIIDVEAGGVERVIIDTIGAITHCFGVWVRKSGWAIYELENSEDVWKTVQAAKYIFESTSNEWGLRSKPLNVSPIRSAGTAWY